MTPMSRSECPPRYFVAAWISTSTPWSNARKLSGVAQVLSNITTARCSCATRAIAGTSWTSNVCEPGDSAYTIRVLGRISEAMASPACGS
jgi:hypothetical protein